LKKKILKDTVRQLETRYVKNKIKQFEPERIVVTGALGHIGSKVIRDFAESFPNTIVVMIDNLLTQRYGSLFKLPTRGRYKFIGNDLFELDLAKILHPGDIVLHLAAITDAAGSFGNQKEVERVNYIGTKKLADACTKVGCKLIFLSTTSVYGTQKELVDEACSKSELKPQSPYAESKLKSEEYLKKKKGLNFVICRFGTICGISHGMRFHTAINKFCWQAINEHPLSVWKTALHQKRPYLTLEDASKAIQFIIRNNLFDRNIYNVVTNNLSVGDIVKMVKKHIPSTKVELVDSPIMNQLSYEVSPAKFQNKGFQFSGNISRSIKETIKLLRKSNDA